MKNDLQVLDLQVDFPVRIAASATRYEVGEPIHSVATQSSGVASANTYVLAAADTPVVGTHRLGGIAKKRCLPLTSGTVVAHETLVNRPAPDSGRIRGKGETAANVDTDAEILLLIQDYTLIDYNSTGGSDGGELYTIKETASADTSGLEIVAGNAANGTLDVVVHARAFRHDVT